MKKKTLIIKLIQEDIKHNQLVLGLRKAGLEGDNMYYLNILQLVFDLLKVPKEQPIEDHCTDLYLNFMEEAIHFKGYRKDDLKPVAEICYRQLKTAVRRGGM